MAGEAVKDYICQHLPKVINSLGLICDIFGALLIFKYGLPESISRTGAEPIQFVTTSEANKAKARRYNTCSRVGLILLAIGFVFQLASNWIPQQR